MLSFCDFADVTGGHCISYGNYGNYGDDNDARTLSIKSEEISAVFLFIMAVIFVLDVDASSAPNLFFAVWISFNGVFGVFF